MGKNDCAGKLPSLFRVIGEVYTCTLCKKKFARDKHLSIHFEKVHLSTKENASHPRTGKAGQKRDFDGNIKRSVKTSKTMETEWIFSNQGLKHVSEKIFGFLDRATLLKCRSVCSSWRNTLQNPSFWIKRSRRYKGEHWKEEHDAWMKIFSCMTSARQSSETFKEVSKKVTPEVLESDVLEFEMTLCLIKRYAYDKSRLKYFTPLHLAVTCGKVNVTNLILSFEEFKSFLDLTYHYKQKKGVWKGKYTPIELAVVRGHVSIVKILFSELTEPLKPDHKGWTLYHHAVNAFNKDKHVHVLNYLKSYSDTPIGHILFPNNVSLLKHAAFKENIECLDYLFENTESPNAPSGNGVSFYEYVISHNHLKSIEYISKKLEDPMVANKNGLNPLHLAALYGKAEVAKYFLTLTDDPNPIVPNQKEFNWRGSTPLYIAASNGSYEVMKIVCEALKRASRGKEISTKCNGWTPFQIAVKKGHLKMVEYLVEFTDNPHFDLCGTKMPFQMAIENKKYDVAQFLFKRMNKRASANDPQIRDTFFDTLLNHLK